MRSIYTVLAGTLLAGGVLLGTAAGFSSASAADDASALSPPAGHGPHGFGPERIFGKLGLSAEQQASIKSIFAAAKPQMKNLREQVRSNHLKLIQTKPDDPSYGNRVAEVAQSNAALASQRTTQGAELRTQLYAVLTPAQKTQFAALEYQWAANPRRGRWQEHGHHPAGPEADAEE